MTTKVVIYSKQSCIPSNDFIDYWKDKTSLTYFRIQDSSFPQIPFDYEYSAIEKKLERKFYTIPIIFIDDTYVSSIKEAYSILREKHESRNL